MIDASRLSHSLATPLKDRPHGIPIQPNRSLPLRPPPPLPTRVSVSKSPKNSPTSQTPTHEPGQIGCSPVASPDKDAAKKGTVRTEDLPSLGLLGMNFYDSKEEEGGIPNDKHKEKLSPIISKGIGRSRHTKSLDNYGSDESNCCGDKKRKSSDWESAHRDFSDPKKRNLLNFGSVHKEADGKIARCDKERRGKKRKTSFAEENYELFGKPKSPRVLNTADAGHPKIVSPTEDKDPIPKSKYFTEKNRDSKSTSPSLVDKSAQPKALNCADVTSGWQQTSVSTYKPILPKPANIPKCPIAIPIEVARAINQGNLRNPNFNVGRNRTDSPMSQNNSIKPKNNVEADRTRVSSETIDDVENTLPSMPSLEDMMQNENLVREKLTTMNGDETDGQKTGSNLGNLVKIHADSLNKTSSLDAEEVSQGNMNVIHDREFDKSHESIVNLTTVLEIQTPGHSPKFIILKAPQIVASDKVDGMANNSSTKATSPVLLPSSIPAALEEPRMIKEVEEIDTFNGHGNDNQQECLTSQEKIVQDRYIPDIGILMKLSPNKVREDLPGKGRPQYTLKRKSPIEFEVRINETSDSPQSQKSEEKPEIPKDTQVKPNRKNILKSKIRRSIKLKLKLQKHREEEAELKYEISQTRDPASLTRLQQRMNCAKKKIENTQKYLSKLISIGNLGLDANPPPSRIQVRRDLIQKLPSPGSLESDSQSPLRPASEMDKDSIGRSLPVSPPLVITISETDSASSDDDTDTSDAKSLDNIKPYIQPDAETKFKYDWITDDEAESDPSDSLPGDKAENVQFKVSPEVTNNNVEYINKNLVPIPKVASTNANTLAAISSPQIPKSPNTASMTIPCVPISLNDTPSSIPQIPTVPISIPPLIRDPIDYSLNKLNDFVNQTAQGAQYGIPKLNLPPDKVDNQTRKQNCNCLSCLRGTAVTAAKNTAQFDGNPYIPNTANDLRTPSTIRRTAVQENTNVNPVPNYPVQRNDYRTSGNVPSMFSRDNGGANINLSSPLQGHSAMPIPPHYYRNLTAQGYQIPAEPSLNQQTPQWHSQQPQSKKSSVPLTPEQEAPLHSSILASHLLKPHVPDPANFPSSITLSSFAQSKDTTTTNPTKRISERVINGQFPTLANWAAQMTRDSTSLRKAPSNPTVDRTAYKTTGSDMYKMAATAIDPTLPPNPTTNTMHWPQPGRPCPSKQPRPAQGYPSQRNIAPYPYRRDYPTNPEIPQNPAKVSATYPGSEVFVTYPTNPYHQVPSGPQNARSNERSSSQQSHHLQNARQYQLPAQSTQLAAPVTSYQKNSPQLVNPIGFMSNQYLQQPPSYVQAMLSQWQSTNNYQNNYVSPQYNNGYNLQSKTMDQNSGLYRTMGKNIAPMPNPVSHLAQNNPNTKLPSAVYGVQPGSLSQGIGQEVRNGDASEIGRSYVAPQLGKVQRSTNRSSVLQCSRCGKPGPNFNCFGCETAFYCDEYCQGQHWSKHLIECSKKMPKLKKVS